MRRAKRAAQVLLLPLSAVPLFGVTPLLAGAYSNFSRRHESGALRALPVRWSRWEAQRYVPLPATPGAVPVLAYDAISSAHDGHAVPRAEFAKQMALLRRLGFRAISIAQYVAFLNGHRRGLPARPVLITFDGGRLDSFRGADRVLRDDGLRATMYVAAGRVRSDDRTLLSWRELNAMQRSGRWDIQERAGTGDDRVSYDAAGDTAPSYVVRRYTRSTGQETLAQWEQRVTSDVFAGQQELAAHLHGFQPLTFAAPGGDVGDRVTNDPRIAGLLGGLLRRQFAVTLTERPGGAPAFSEPSSDHAMVERLPVGEATSTDALFRWLRDGTRLGVAQSLSPDNLYRWLRAGAPRLPPPPRTEQPHVRNRRLRG